VLLAALKGSGCNRDLSALTHQLCYLDCIREGFASSSASSRLSSLSHPAKTPVTDVWFPGLLPSPKSSFCSLKFHL